MQAVMRIRLFSATCSMFEMDLKCAITLMSIVLGFQHNAESAAEVRLTQQTPCLPGQSCRLQCSVVSGTNVNGLEFRKDTLTVVSCPGGRDSCLAEFPGLYSLTQVDSSTTYVDIRSFDNSTDAALWSCSDGSRETPSNLSVVQNTVPVGPLTWGSTCVSGRAISPASLSCSLLSPAVPPASFTIKNSNNQQVNSSQGSVVGTVTIGGQASCSVTWPAFPSYTITISPVQCTVQVVANATVSVRDKVITCQAEGYPDNYTFQSWLQSWGEQEVRRVRGSQQGGQYSLTLTSYQDTGTYTCTVDNGVLDTSGKLIQRSESVNVTVEDAPVLPLPMDPARFAGEEGEPVHLYRSVFASPDLASYTWFFNSTDVTSLIPGATKNTSRDMVFLSVYNKTVTTEGSVVNLYFQASQKYNGQYRLEVCNSIGCNSANVSLVAASAPFSPENLAAQPSTDSVELSWTPGFAGGDFFQWFHVQYRRQDGQEGPWSDVSTADNRSNSDKTPVTVTVQGLQPDTSYVFRVRAQSSRPKRNLSNFTEVAAQTATEPSSGALIGGIVGGILGAVAVIIVVICFVLRRRKTARGHDEKPLKKSTAKDAQQGSANTAFSSSPVKENAHSAHPILDDNPLYDSSANDATHGPSTSAPKKKNVSTPPSSAAADVYAVVDKTKKKADDKGKKRDKKKDKKDKTGSKIYENSDGVAVSDKAPEKPGPVREIVGGCEYVSVEIVGKPGEAARAAPAKKPKPSRPDDQYKNDAVVYTVIDHSKRS